MQDRTGEAFVIATANQVENLPPELLRTGRFDQVFWIDLPNESERESILAATLRKHNRDKLPIDHKRIAEATEKFTGSEIAELVPSAMFAAFGDNEREITTEDLISAAQTVVPLSKTSAEKIDAMRNWAKGRARPASSTQSVSAEKRKQVRALDIE
jgi:SpoVK/Ycf46/Vps4 family AAA+-type ATPase